MPKAKLTAGHDAVLRLVDWLPEDAEPDAVFVGDLLCIGEREAARLLDELEQSGLLASGEGGLQ